MLKRPVSTALATLLLALVLGYGLIRLFALRLERGDVYPAYSSLRSDPLGSRGFLDALNGLEGVDAERNFRSLTHLNPVEPFTILYPGVSRSAEWSSAELSHFELLVGKGARAVFAFAPADLAPESRGRESSDEPSGSAEDTEKKKSSDKREDGDDGKRRGAQLIPFKEVAERWGAKFDVAIGKQAGSFHEEATLSDSADMEAAISWHSALRFTELQPAWRVLYRSAGQPVIIERQWGDGTIVLASDSYFLSNEALQTEPSPRLLGWAAGPFQRVIFDEEHLGVAEEIGIVNLAQKYRLQGAMLALAVVAGLWLWRQTARFVPASLREKQREEFVAGLDSQAGFTSLLRRTIAPGSLLEVCATEWRKTFGHERQKVALVEEVLSGELARPARQRDPVGAYRRICQIVGKR